MGKIAFSRPAGPTASSGITGLMDFKPWMSWHAETTRLHSELEALTTKVPDMKLESCLKSASELREEVVSVLASGAEQAVGEISDALSGYCPSWAEAVDGWDEEGIKQVIKNPHHGTLSTQVSQLNMALDVLEELAKLFGPGFSVSQVVLTGARATAGTGKSTIGAVAILNYILFRALAASNAKSNGAMVREIRRLLKYEKIEVPEKLQQKMMDTLKGGEDDAGDAGGAAAAGEAPAAKRSRRCK